MLLEIAKVIESGSALNIEKLEVSNNWSPFIKPGKCMANCIIVIPGESMWQKFELIPIQSGIYSCLGDGTTLYDGSVLGWSGHECFDLQFLNSSSIKEKKNTTHIVEVCKEKVENFYIMKKDTDVVFFNGASQYMKTC